MENYADAARRPKTLTEREQPALLKVTDDGATDRRGGRAFIAPVRAVRVVPTHRVCRVQRTCSTAHRGEHDGLVPLRSVELMCEAGAQWVPTPCTLASTCAAPCESVA
jgi:hypothetical protein